MNRLKSFRYTTTFLVFFWLAVLNGLGVSAASSQFSQSKLSNPRTGYYPGGEMGRSVAVDGDTMIVGAPYADTLDPSSSAGAAWIYTSDGMGGWRTQARFSATSESEIFGASVAISSDTAIVGALASNGFHGFVYIYNRSNGLWTLQAKIQGSEGNTSRFGISVSVHGDTTVVGDDGAGNNAGSFSIFTRTNNNWTYQTTLVASDAAPNNHFGHSVSVSGDTAVAGAYYDDAGGKYSGSSYVFVRNGSTWNQQAKLTASDAGPNDQFGQAVSISGDTVIIGADGDDIAGYSSGSSYVFTRSGAAWTQQAKLSASDVSEGDHFGISVSLSGDMAVVGADRGGNEGIASGAAYVFTRSGSNWTQQQKLTASDAAAGDCLGRSVSTSNGIIALGAYAHNGPQGMDSGSAYVFTLSSGVWTEQGKLVPTDPVIGDGLGKCVSISGGTAVVGAPSHSTAGANSGAAYVYTWSHGVWTLQARLTGSDAMPGDSFGSSSAIEGDTVVIGATSAKGNQLGSGAAYVFTRSDGIWTQQAKLIASDGLGGDMLGCSASISGNTIIAGAYGDDNDDHFTDTGAAYVFTCNNNIWTQQDILKANSNVYMNSHEYFGWSVSIFGDTAIVGQPGFGGAGLVHVFTRSGGIWSKKTLMGEGYQSGYGLSVSISGDTFVVGEANLGGRASGAAYVYTLNDSAWTKQAKLTVSNCAADDHFGISVSISGEMIIIGMDQDDDAGSNAGAAYLFKRNGSTWTQQAKLLAYDAAADDILGYAVAISAGRAIIGAPAKADPEIKSGSAYAIDLSSLVQPTRANSDWILFR